MQLDQLRIPGTSELERLVERSRLIGGDARLVVHGGGNTSSKIQEHDHLGRERTVLRIKGSGTNLATIAASGFPGLYLDELLPLRERDAMTDEEMVAYLERCMVEPGAPRPSIETLLHAFIPARHVDHVHADAICALTNSPEARRAIPEALGEDVAVVSYIRPGFELSRRVAQLADHRAVVLAHHGLVTWGDTHEESYGLTLELVARAEAYLAERKSPSSPPAVPSLDGERLEELLVRLRGRLSRDGRRVLHTDPSQRELADRDDVRSVAEAGRATPDHVLRIGARTLVAVEPEEVDAAVEDFEAESAAYFERNRSRGEDGLEPRASLPSVALVPGLGCVAAGDDARSARMNAEIALHSHGVAATVLDAFGRTEWLDEADIFDFDYWPLELYKLTLAPPPPELA
ncbi:MAG TPA: class II aldolase/adducin family protein, partial [Gaiellaceae bacterium]|nr:class II aldolase/adducin family protein [Gaiellaceae bacterium]